MNNDSKRRITMSLPKDLDDRLDKLCELIGLPRRYMVKWFVYEGILKYENEFMLEDELEN